MRRFKQQSWHDNLKLARFLHHTVVFTILELWHAFWSSSPKYRIIDPVAMLAESSNMTMGLMHVSLPHVAVVLATRSMHLREIASMPEMSRPRRAPGSALLDRKGCIPVVAKRPSGEQTGPVWRSAGKLPTWSVALATLVPSPEKSAQGQSLLLGFEREYKPIGSGAQVYGRS